MDEMIHGHLVRRADAEKWDLRFLNVAKEHAMWSKDPSTKTGAVIVRPDRTEASYGYNGFPKGMPDDTELYINRDEKYSRIIHCEMNALINARERLTSYTLYTWPFASCDRCVVHMIQAGISRFVFPSPSVDALSRWADSIARTKRYIVEVGAYWTEVTD